MPDQVRGFEWLFDNYGCLTIFAQVLAVGFGMKSRSWVAVNPVASKLRVNHPELQWSWDIGRSVHVHMDAIPVFTYDPLDGGARNPKEIIVFGLLGMRE